MGSGITPGMRLAPHLKLIQALGQGAMGKVWLAEDVRRGTHVAVKFLAYGRQRDPTAVARFEREFATASTIDSPHVVRMLEFASMADGVPYIVMELIEGDTLEERLEHQVALTLAEIIAVLRQVGHALDAAHARGIVHRDVKPDNIVLVANRSGFHCKVLDFGLAKPWSRQTLTGSGVAMGTPDYMSPEQVLGGKHVDHRADLWALAVIAYRLLCGDFPFQADSVHALMFIICRGQFARPSTFGAPAAFDEWFEQAFHPDIDKRFRSASAMLRALDGAVDSLDEQSQTAIMRRAAMHALVAAGESDDGKTRVRKPERPARPAPPALPAAPSQPSTDVLPRPDLEFFGASDDDKTALRPPRSESEPTASERPPSLRPARPPSHREPEDGSIMPMLALVVAAMALGFGAAAAWKHHLFDRLLPGRETNAPRSVQEPSTNRRAIPSEGRSSEPSSTTQPSAEPEGDSFLSVSCHPACVVWIGKRDLGISPVVKAPVPPGRHRVVVYRDGVGSKVLLVHVDRGEHASYDVTMNEPAPEPEPSAAPAASVSNPEP